MRDYSDLLEESPRTRVIVMGILLFWMVLGPVVSQVLVPGTEWFRSWTMYTGVGRGLRDVRFFVARNGTLEAVDWPSLPERKQPFGRRGPFRRTISSDADFRWAADQMCDELGADADLRAIVRVGVNEGWVPLLSGERNLCAESANDR